MMNYVLYGVAALVALLVAMAAVGAMLPRDHIASRTQSLPKPPAEVFPLIAGKQNWRPGSEKDPPSIVVESTPPKRHITRISDPSLPYGGTWTFELEPDTGGKSKLTITEAGFVINPLFRFLSRFVFGHYATMDAYLKHLTAHLSKGA